MASPRLSRPARPALLKAARTGVACAVLAFAGIATSPHMAAAENATSGALDRKQVEQIVREYLLANPEILIDMQEELEKKETELQRVSQLGVIRDSRDDLFNAPTDAVVGNPQGKVTIVEFFDYNCGFCKRALPDMVALTKDDPELRFVLKEYPILGQDSLKAHIVSQAFLKIMPEKYSEFHAKLLGNQGRAGEDTAIELALSLGADKAELRKAMEDPSITDGFKKTHDLAERLLITGTPSYVVGNEVVFGALGTDVLAQKIAAAKSCIDNADC